MRVRAAAAGDRQPPSSAVATESRRRFWARGREIVSAALVVSIFSALQVMTLLAARVPCTMASDGFLKWLAELSPRRIAVRALMLQAVWACVSYSPVLRC